MTTAESFDLGMNADCTIPTEAKSQILVGVSGFLSGAKKVVNK